MKNKHRYPEDWNDRIRPMILARDKYTCDDCKAKHRAHGYYVGNTFFELLDTFQIDWAKKQGHKVTKIHLQIAHLDQNPNNNEPENLKSKCPKCHLRYDNQFNMLKRKMKRPNT